MTSLLTNVGTLIAVVVCLALLVAGATVVRFALARSARVPGWQERLRTPQRGEVEGEWHVTIPESLETFYRSKVVLRSNFYLAPPGTSLEQWWYIERFVPLNLKDLLEWRTSTGVPGLPIALDAAKGAYYLPLEALRAQAPCPVFLRLPGTQQDDRQVAASFEEFSRFEPRDPDAE